MFASKDIFLKSSGGYQISRSVRLRSSASAYFNRTPSASSRTTWTWAAWVKRGKLGSAQVLFSAGTGTAEFRLTFTSSDTIEIYEYTSPSYNWQKITTAVYRDPSAWYQIQLVYDTTNGTAADRVKLYVNGVQVTSFGTNTNPTSSFSGYVNSAVAHGIGSFSTGANYLDGYMTEINFIDGQALTPSSFGSTNSVTGVWQPIKYTGTYGTNGFYLNFSDNSNNTATTIGKDYSGNGNNWTPNNISVTAGATYDSMLDVPTPWADGGNGRGNYAVFNPVNVSGGGSTITDGNLACSAGSTTTFGKILGSIGMNTGKWYWEVTITAVGSLAMCGVGDGTPPSGSAGLGGVAGELAYQSNGNKYTNGSASAYGATYTTNDVIGVAYDADAGSITFYKNNTSQGSITGLSGTKYPAVGSGGGTNPQYAINFGQRPFSYTPPSGFVALNTQNLPTPTITNGATVMAATLYTGNGSTQTISNTVGFYPDLAWIKARNNVGSNVLTNSVVGGTKQLFSNLTNAEQTDTNMTNGISASGVALGNNSSGTGSTNQNAYTYVAWMWNAGAGTTSSNTSGSITSTVSVNATAGFSIVTYTGTGANATVGHGLGVAPKMVIVKRRDTGPSSWTVWHTSFSSIEYIYLNLTNAKSSSSGATVWNSTLPSSTVFSLGTYSDVNASAGTYVAYCWSEVAGFSKFGSYTGNGSTDGPFVFTNFQPRWVMVKRTDSTSDWYIWDTSRDTYNVESATLLADTSGAETSATSIDGLSNGFKCRSATVVNASGGTYIYAAFASSPFKLSLAR